MASCEALCGDAGSDCVILSRLTPGTWQEDGGRRQEEEAACCRLIRCDALPAADNDSRLQSNLDVTRKCIKFTKSGHTAHRFIIGSK